MRPVVLLLPVAMPMSVRPTATTPGNPLHLLEDHLALWEKLGRLMFSTWRM